MWPTNSRQSVDAAQAMLLSLQAGDSTAWLGQHAANSDITCTAGPVSAAAAARVHVSAVSQWLCLVLTIEAARLAAKQKDGAGVAEDLLSVPVVKSGDSLSGDRGPGVGFPSHCSMWFLPFLPLIELVGFFSQIVITANCYCIIIAEWHFSFSFCLHTFVLFLRDFSNWPFTGVVMA